MSALFSFVLNIDVIIDFGILNCLSDVKRSTTTPPDEFNLNRLMHKRLFRVLSYSWVCIMMSGFRAKWRVDLLFFPTCRNPFATMQCANKKKVYVYFSLWCFDWCPSDLACSLNKCSSIDVIFLIKTRLNTLSSSACPINHLHSILTQRLSTIMMNIPTHDPIHSH